MKYAHFVVILSMACGAIACSSSSSSGNTVTCGPGTQLQDNACVATPEGDGGTTITCGSGTVLQDGQCVVGTGDTDKPNFAGIASVTSTSTTSVKLTWAAASDAKTTPDKIYYHVYVSQTTGTETFGSPQFTSLPGKTTFDVTGLDAGVAYFFVVRAVNTIGNEDGNTVEKSVSTSNDSTPPQFAGLLFVDFTGTSAGVCSKDTDCTTGGNHCIGGQCLPQISQATLTWAPATDDQTGASEIAYDVYDSTTPSGENFAGKPTISVAGVNTAVVPNVDSNLSHYYVVLARDKGGNTNPNKVERKLAIVPNLTDHIMPILAGIPGQPNSAKCARSGCHIGPTAPGGLQMDTPANAYAGLVNIAASSRYLPWTIQELTEDGGTPTTIDTDAGPVAMGNVSFGPLTLAQYAGRGTYNETTAFRVIPNLPLVSFMYQKITNTHKRLKPNDQGNAEMPNPASTGQTLTAEERDRIMRWIAGGALLTAP